MPHFKKDDMRTAKIGQPFWPDHRYEYFDFILLCNFAVLWQVSESQTTEGREGEERVGGRPQLTRNAQKRDGGRLPKVLGAVQSSETLSRRERDGPPNRVLGMGRTWIERFKAYDNVREENRTRLRSTLYPARKKVQVSSGSGGQVAR